MIFIFSAHLVVASTIGEGKRFEKREIIAIDTVYFHKIPMSLFEKAKALAGTFLPGLTLVSHAMKPATEPPNTQRNKYVFASFLSLNKSPTSRLMLTRFFSSYPQPCVQCLPRQGS